MEKRSYASVSVVREPLDVTWWLAAVVLGSFSYTLVPDRYPSQLANHGSLIWATGLAAVGTEQIRPAYASMSNLGSIIATAA